MNGDTTKAFPCRVPLLGTASPAVWLMNESSSNNSDTFGVIDIYSLEKPIQELFNKGDLITIAFDWCINDPNNELPDGILAVECSYPGSSNVWTWGDVVSVSGGEEVFISSSNRPSIRVTQNCRKGHLVATIKITEAQASVTAQGFKKLRLRWDGDPANTAIKAATLTISNAKLVRGNVITDWSAAPQDSVPFNINLAEGSEKYRENSPYELSQDPNNKVDDLYRYIDVYVNLVSGKTYTISCSANSYWSTHPNSGADYSKWSGQCTVWLTWDQSDAKKHVYFGGDGTEYGRKSWQYTATYTGKHQFRVNTYDKNSTKKLKFWDFKVEEGTVATGWAASTEGLVSSNVNTNNFSWKFSPSEGMFMWNGQQGTDQSDPTRGALLAIYNRGSQEAPEYIMKMRGHIESDSGHLGAFDISTTGLTSDYLILTEQNAIFPAGTALQIGDNNVIITQQKEKSEDTQDSICMFTNSEKNFVISNSKAGIRFLAEQQSDSVVLNGTLSLATGDAGVGNGVDNWQFYLTIKYDLGTGSLLFAQTKTISLTFKWRHKPLFSSEYYNNDICDVVLEIPANSSKGTCNIKSVTVKKEEEYGFKHKSGDNRIFIYRLIDVI